MKGSNRKKEYDKKHSDEEAQVKHYMEQQAIDFERTLETSNRLALVEFMTEKGIEMLIGFCEEELLRRRGEKKPSGLVDANGNSL